MSNDKLQAKLKIINASYDKGREILLGLQEDVKKTNEELLKLQGEFRAVTKLIEEENEVKETVKKK